MKSSHHTAVTQLLEKIKKLNIELLHVRNCSTVLFLQNDQIRVTVGSINKVLFPLITGAIISHLEQQKADIIEQLKSYNVEYDGD